MTTRSIAGARRRERLQNAGIEETLPSLLLAPALLLVLAVVVYPLIDGIRTSTRFYRFGRALESVGLQNYRDALDDPQFTGALWTTAKFVTLAVAIETVLGLGLAMLCLRELRVIRWA